MKIVDAAWGDKTNVLVIECECGRIFTHRADRWNVRCPSCRSKAHLSTLRDQIRPGDITPRPPQDA
jgi:hypothetical protein